MKDTQEQMFAVMEVLDTMDMDHKVRKFASESNKIEGIMVPSRGVLHATQLKKLLVLKKLTILDLIQFVSKIEEKAYLREVEGDDVWIGGRKAPPAEQSKKALFDLLEDINKNQITAFEAHNHYEMIHPFTDGNGRSGRAIWLWIMVNRHGWKLEIPFLQMYYYQTLTDWAELYFDEE